MASCKTRKNYYALNGVCECAFGASKVVHGVAGYARGLINLRATHVFSFELGRPDQSTHLIKEGWGLLRVYPT